MSVCWTESKVTNLSWPQWINTVEHQQLSVYVRQRALCLKCCDKLIAAAPHCLKQTTERRLTLSLVPDSMTNGSMSVFLTYISTFYLSRCSTISSLPLIQYCHNFICSIMPLFPHHFLHPCNLALHPHFEKCKSSLCSPSHLSPVGWVTSSLATVAASTCWRKVNSGILMSSAPAAPRCNPLGASVTCSGTHTAAIPCPPSESQRGRGREGSEERWRQSAGTKMEEEEGGRKKRGGNSGANIFSSVLKTLGGLSAGWREYGSLLFLVVRIIVI